jgi:radical SAM superfamily enzyme YgiQ (UPF0313 family)
MILLAHSYFLRDDAKQFARMKPYAPLATLLAAALLREHGHRVALFDAMLADSMEEFRAALASSQASVVGILEDNFNFLTKMCTERMREATLEMIRDARAVGCRVVVNGSDATDNPLLYLEAGADAVLLGDGEATMLAIADALRADPLASLNDIEGLVLHDATGAMARTPARAATRELDSLPYPAWDLVDVEAYRRAWTKAHGRLSWNMATSRGCPFGCNWCAKPVFGRRYTQRSPESVAKEMRALKDAVKPDHVWFADDIFGLTPQWIERFAVAVEELGARIPFMIQCRADLLQPRVALALARAGAEEVWLGVESGSQKVLDAMEKGTTIHEVREATRALRAHRIRVCWFLQLGYPSETWDDVLLTRNLVRDERPDDIGVSVAYPLPGTRFHAAVEAQLGARRNWRDTGELAMLFQGTYTTDFYRVLRDVLHDEARTRGRDDARWSALAAQESAHRSPEPSRVDS